MPTPDAALKNFSAVIITGGSSGIGKSFIELCGRMRPELAFCNLSRRAPVIANPQLNLRHIGCDLSQPAQVERALSGIEDFLKHQAPAGRILLLNNSGFGVYGRFPEPGIGQHLEAVVLADPDAEAILARRRDRLRAAAKARQAAAVTGQ